MKLNVDKFSRLPLSLLSKVKMALLKTYLHSI